MEGALKQDHMLADAVLGFLLAWDKVSLGDEAVWVGAQLLKTSAFEVPFQWTRFDALRGETSRFFSATVAQKKDVRSFCGKLSFVAGMVSMLWPFVGIVWAALASSSGLPLELVHCRRFRVALWWLQALFSEVPGPYVRVSPVATSWASDERPAQVRGSGRPSTTPLVKLPPSSWPYGSGCQERGSWRVSGLKHSGGAALQQVRRPRRCCP